MAESYIGVTEGVGKKLHSFDRTIGANTVHDEVVILGEQYLSSYSATTGNAASTGTALAHTFQLMAGASLVVRVRRIEIYQAVLATTATIADFALIRLTTAGSGGTSTPPNPLDTTSPAAGATVMRLPTAKGTEGATIGVYYASLMQTLGASTQMTNPILVIDFDRPRSQPLIIPAGTSNGICFRVGTAVAGASISYNILFDEALF